MHTERQTIGEITVALGDRSYPIVIGRNVLERLTELLERTGTKGSAAIVTDENVASLYCERVCSEVERAGFTPVQCVMPAGEEHKRLARIEELCGEFLEGALDRSSIVIALGGSKQGPV